MTSPLSPSNITLLRRCVERYAPELLPLTGDADHEAFTEADREALRGAVLAEFLAAGRNRDDEPTPYGLELEDLIDALGADKADRDVN